MRRTLDFLWALYELARLALITRFNFKGKYWTWRWQTALGPQGANKFTSRQRWHAMIEYGRWVARMRRF
ncbi:MAG: hypothetical protein U0640_02875 [Phycisphaerales bacterium]